ncbi:DUF2867 domain-containing protein [Labilibaculum sp.]|uniref:DUF2867 domain-containing protein n=1 Tax=Labilibaculum sp. TaxID=2060723 RepID=UPI002AA6270D|nr:DUF2867 domain-containing protein [Labilibaculum sp.]MBN2597671.1 DUF2867 domain-containing protein [Marinifilaceae bacterium]
MIEKLKIIPEQSLLKKEEQSYHYIDSFQSQYIASEFDIIYLGKSFLSSSPKWVDNLMAIRDKLVGVFGLKTSAQLKAMQDVDNLKFEPGAQLDIFKLYNITENELILGEDDKHLSFRVSLLLDSINDDVNKKRIILTTMVEFKNLFGRLYFIPVKPFHQLIVKETLKEMIINIEKH